MLEFNQSHGGGGGGGFDSPGPSLVETVQVVIRSAKWNYNPENSSAPSQLHPGGGSQSRPGFMDLSAGVDLLSAQNLLLGSLSKFSLTGSMSEGTFTEPNLRDGPAESSRVENHQIGFLIQRNLSVMFSADPQTFTVLRSEKPDPPLGGLESWSPRGSVRLCGPSGSECFPQIRQSRVIWKASGRPYLRSTNGPIKGPRQRLRLRVWTWSQDYPGVWCSDQDLGVTNKFKRLFLTCSADLRQVEQMVPGPGPSNMVFRSDSLTKSSHTRRNPDVPVCSLIWDQARTGDKERRDLKSCSAVSRQTGQGPRRCPQSTRPPPSDQRGWASSKCRDWSVALWPAPFQRKQEIKDRAPSRDDTRARRESEGRERGASERGERGGRERVWPKTSTGVRWAAGRPKTFETPPQVRSAVDPQFQFDELHPHGGGGGLADWDSPGPSPVLIRWSRIIEEVSTERVCRSVKESECLGPSSVLR
ncbi:Hypothetical predicted protein [Xyrichtys novacula]|uniref:Uncharacterized protein n=1 Tax=Xyrichtys novacula TaxID=13765 RepID=A0AAV1FF92_XYRNO|nr:Hypothetical predicted protein [Xyrichtys novacula]